MKRTDIHNNKKMKKHRIKKRVWSGLLIVLLLLFIPLSNVLGILKNLNSMVVKDEKKEVSQGKEKKYTGKFGFLILGVDDSEDDDRGIGNARTDTMIYGTFNSESKTIDMVSIPRDVYTDIYSNGEVVATDKINSAYIYNEEQSAIETVENWLGLPVEYYATVDFDGFKDIIDAVGGVKVNVPYDLNENYEKDNSGKTLVPKGDNQLLNGEQALIFSRIRKMDDDIKRGERQQEVITSVVNSFIANPSMDVLDNVTKIMGSNIKTNMSENVMLQIALSMTSSYNIESHVFDWTDFEKDGMSMVDVFEDSKEFNVHLFKAELGLEDKDERDKPDYKFKSNGYSLLRDVYGAYGSPNPYPDESLLTKGTTSTYGEDNSTSYNNGNTGNQ